MLALLALVALVSACGGGEAAEVQGRAGRGGGGGPGGPGGAGGRMAAVPVEVARVEEGAIARTVTVSGVVDPIRNVGVNSQLAGALLDVMVEEGDRVAAGQPLARLDDRELRAQLDAAESAWQVASAALERAEQLRERRVITLPEYERERTAEAAARAQLDQVRTRLGYTVVRAPVDGVVTHKAVEGGDVVAPNTRLFTVADVSTLVVRVGVSELDVVQLSVGDPVAVILDAYGERPFAGRIRRVFPTADPDTRLVPVEVALEASDATVARPGFLARVTFAVGAHDGVLLIPASAVIGGSGTQAVFVVDDGAAIRRTVTTGLSSQGRVEVLSGLRPGEVVITKGNTMLRDGMTVRVVNELAAGLEGG